jgi:hypothetical protein
MAGLPVCFFASFFAGLFPACLLASWPAFFVIRCGFGAAIPLLLSPCFFPPASFPVLLSPCFFHRASFTAFI